ncbi:MFS transporter [Streptomyces guryensis]|uniref:MFS transporter n=1 Tax=Streptomyces guryensis TaxID=2886947 RepID=A0A9Q3ZER7_9ACTN|nr:MFS transporter [Streptomyces guryensis]MCD9879705.1 MFS transporter [Streptomyces guryensis]
MNESTLIETPPTSRRQLLKPLSGLLLALFVSTLSSTVVSSGLPKIIGAVNGTQTQYTWVVTATLLTTTATTPLWGKLADLFSKKALLQASLAIFVLGALASGISQTGGQLIAARALQGVGVGGAQALVQIAIAAMIPPRERGRYSGYVSGVTSTSTIGGPLLGGIIVDTSWLGWRWCFFIAVPLAAVAFLLLQRTLNLPVISRENVKIDYLGATLIASGVSVLLIWVSFVDNSFAWVSWQTAAMVSGALALLAAALWVEKRAAEPVVPLGIVKQRTTALAILGSLAVGTAMFGTAVFLSQYFQLSRGNTPTEAGLLTIPMMAGTLIASIVAGRLISRSGKIKPYVITGAVLLTAGSAGLGAINHKTPMLFLGAAMLCVGMGVGLTLQNFVLVVQNTVPLKDVGAASSTVSFFRSLGGTIGVSVLGAVLARQVHDGIANGMASAGMSGAGLPSEAAAQSPATREIIRIAYGDATAQIFLLSAAAAVLAIVAALLLKPVNLRSSLDLPEKTGESPASAPDPDPGTRSSV